MATPFPDDLVLTPVSRWPTTLPPETLRDVLDTPVPERVARRARPADTAAPPPLVSVIVVTRDGLAFSRLCFESLLAIDTPIDYELVIVDNASSDGTVAYLGALAARDERVRVRFNAHNAGFAAATNQGAAIALGSILVLLNNDTIVSDGWLDRVVTHLADERIGLLGAVTNRAGNEAEIEVAYHTYGERQRFAREHMHAHTGLLFDIRTVTMFCAALRHDVWTAVGPLDERFALGLFEDDDYSMRVRQAGYRVACAEDLFIHHFGQASIGRLGPTGEYGDLFHTNRTRWEEKWGVSWQPYARRDKPAYRDLVSRIRQQVDAEVPPGATLAVISKGDPALVQFDGRRAWHFPHAEGGAYAGHHPADSDACIDALERLRADGAEFLVIPASAHWWLEHYAQFGAHLRTRYGATDDAATPATIVALADRRE